MSRRRGTHGGSVRQRAGRWYISFREPRVSADGALTYQKVERAVEGATSAKDALRKGYDQHVSKANSLAHTPQDNGGKGYWKKSGHANGT